MAESRPKFHSCISKNDDYQHMDQGDGDTIFQHLVRIQAMSHWDCPHTDGQQELSIERHSGDKPIGNGIQARLGGKSDDDGTAYRSSSGAIGHLCNEPGKDH